MFPSEQPSYFSWPYPSVQPQYPTAEDHLYSASMGNQDRVMSAPSHYSLPQQQQYYPTAQYGTADLQQQGYTSGMDASVYGQNYADDQGYVLQDDSYTRGEEYSLPHHQAAGYNGQGYEYSTGYRTAGAQYDTSGSSYDPQNTSNYMQSMDPSTMQDLQYPMQRTYDQADTSSIYTQPRLYSPVDASPTVHMQASYSGPSRQQSSAHYTAQPLAGQQQRLAAFESPASRSARLKISEPVPAPGIRSGTPSGLARTNSGNSSHSGICGYVNSHMTKVQDKLKEAQVMKGLLVEQLARTAPVWCVVLNYLGPAAAKQTVYTSAELVQLFHERKVTCATLLLGVSTNNPAVVRRHVNPAFLRPLVFLLSLLKSGATYIPASEADLSREFPAPGWCIPACCFKPRSRKITDQSRSAKGGRGPSRQGYINQLQALSDRNPPSLATDDDEASGADRLLRSVPLWAVLTSYTQMGAWRCPPNIPGNEAARQFAAGALSASTPILGTLDAAHRGQWMPTGLVLPLGVILHLIMHEGLEYTPIPAADLSFYTIDVLKTVTGKPDRTALWLAAAAAGDECALAVMAAHGVPHSDHGRSESQLAMKGITPSLWTTHHTSTPALVTRNSSGAGAGSGFGSALEPGSGSTSASLVEPRVSRGSGAGSAPLGFAASLAGLDVNSNTSEESNDFGLDVRGDPWPTAAPMAQGPSPHISTLGNKQLITSWAPAPADAVTFASVDRERAQAESRPVLPSHTDTTPHLPETGMPVAARWHVVTQESSDHPSPDQTTSSTSAASPETVREAGQQESTLQSTANATHPLRDPLSAETGMPVQPRVSGMCFGSLEIEGNANKEGTALRQERTISRLASAGSLTNGAPTSSSTTQPGADGVLFVMESGTGPLNIVLAPAGFSASAAGSSLGLSSTTSPDAVGIRPFIPGAKPLAGAVRAKPAAFAMPVPMAVTKSATQKSTPAKSGRSKAGAILLPVPVAIPQPSTLQASSPSSPQLPPCGISALSPTSLPFCKFETAVFRLFMGDTSQYSFTSLWWYLDAFNSPNKVLGPFSCEQMMLAYIAQLLNNNIPVCGSVAAVTTPLQPHVTHFRPLGDLILDVGANIPYRLATVDDVTSFAAEPCITAQLSQPEIGTSELMGNAEASEVL